MWHSRHLCCVTLQTCLLFGAAGSVTQQTCLPCDTADKSASWHSQQVLCAHGTADVVCHCRHRLERLSRHSLSAIIRLPLHHACSRQCFVCRKADSFRCAKQRRSVSAGPPHSRHRALCDTADRTQMSVATNNRLISSVAQQVRPRIRQQQNRPGQGGCLCFASAVSPSVRGIDSCVDNCQFLWTDFALCRNRKHA